MIRLGKKDKRIIQEYADRAGADRWEVVRMGKHRIVDLWFGDEKVRTTVAVSPSDFRSMRNAVAEAKRKLIGMREIRQRRENAA